MNTELSAQFTPFSHSLIHAFIQLTGTMDSKMSKTKLLTYSDEAKRKLHTIYYTSMKSIVGKMYASLPEVNSEI